MRKNLTVRRVALFGLILGGFAMLISDDHAQARPQYNKAFLKKYPDLAGAAKKVKCNVCHVGKKKKPRNDYGKAIAKHIGKKNQKDADAIEKALNAAAGEKNAKGQTFGSLIKAGKLPGTAP